MFLDNEHFNFSKYATKSPKLINIQQILVVHWETRETSLHSNLSFIIMQLKKIKQVYQCARLRRIYCRANRYQLSKKSWKQKGQLVFGNWRRYINFTYKCTNKFVLYFELDSKIVVEIKFWCNDQYLSIVIVHIVYAVFCKSCSVENMLLHLQIFQEAFRTINISWWLAEM